MDYLIDFSEQELGITATALMELPYKTVAPLLDKINRRILEQQQAMQAAQAPVEEAPAEPQEKPAEPQEEPAPAESE